MYKIQNTITSNKIKLGKFTETQANVVVWKLRCC